MKSLVTAPTAASSLEFRNVDEPRPEPDQAVVAVRACSVNRGELALMALRPEGWRPGQDISGVVEVPASDGSGPAKGERIFGIVEGAGWSEKAAVRTDRLATLPKGVAFEIGAALPMAGLTALRLTRLAGPSCASAHS
jgi:NADPH:quinone reductase